MTNESRLGMVLGMEQPPIFHAPMDRFTNPATDIPSYILAMGGELVKKTGKKPAMIICFLARKPCEEYAIIKRFGDVEKGVPTQCLFINKAKKGNPQCESIFYLESISCFYWTVC